MTALPLRPALADVLAAITDEPRGHWIARFADPSLRGGPTFVRGAVSMSFAVDRFRAPVRKNLTRLTITDPAEACEALIARGVLPDEWAGDVRRAFWCVHCFGRGVVSDEYAGGSASWPCEYCAPPGRDTGSGLCATPPLIAELVSWASLGPAAILRAEELARETVRRLRPWGAPQPERVVWRVGERPAADSVLWRDSIYNFCVISRRGVLIGHADKGGQIWRQSGPIPPACNLWDMGLAIDSITADAITIVVPPAGAP